MKSGLISVRRALAFAWPAFKKHWRLFGAILLLMLAAWIALEIVVITGQRFGLLLWITAHLVFLVSFACIQIGFLRTCLALHDHREARLTDAFAPFSLGIRFLAALALYALVVALGLALLVAPGVYLGARYAFFGYYFANGEPSIGNAFRSAARLADGAILDLGVILAALLVFNLLGAAILGIGLLITIPVSGLFLTDIYRQLSPLRQPITQ
jgi:uncharacterized membrane protein